MKYCPRCEKDKENIEFYKNVSKYDGYQGMCKECWRAYSVIKGKEYSYRNSAKISKAKKIYHQKNRDKILEKKRQHWAENKEVLNQNRRDKYPQTRERSLVTNRKYYKKNKNTVNEQKKEYNKRNAFKIRVWKRIYKIDKLKNDPIFKFIEHTRRRINIVLKKKTLGTYKLLGCSGKIAFDHLSSMGYDSAIHHIDHIIPLNRFDLSIEYHQLFAFNYYNLQPLSISNNCKKKDNLPDNWDVVLEKIGKNIYKNTEPVSKYIEANCE